MSVTTESDTYKYVHSLGVLTLALIVFIAGLLIQSFIIGVNVNDWWKGRSVTPVDHIVTSLGISRMLIQCVNLLYMSVLTLSLSNLDSHLLLISIGYMYDLLINANIWLTSLLSIVLCLKISNLHTRLFLYLRRMILQRTVYLIVASILLSTVNCLIPMVMGITKVTRVKTYNTTMGSLVMDYTFITAIYNFIIGASFPMLFCSISSVFLFSSLYHHTTRMKMSNNLSINLETYYSLMRFVSFTFLYSTIYFIGQFIGHFFYHFSCAVLEWLFIVLDFLPVLHSSYLIYRTAKLRDQMSKVLHNVIGVIFQSKNTETRENIEMAAQ